MNTNPCPVSQVVRALDSESESFDLSNGVKYGQSAIYHGAEDIQRFRRMAFAEDSSEFELYSGEFQSKEASYRGSSSSINVNDSEIRPVK